MTTAPNLLRKAAKIIDQRAASRDLPQERSMGRTVRAFNALSGLTLSETQGWLFMAVLKLSRALGGGFNEDDLLDGAAYMALALEHQMLYAPETACEAQDGVFDHQEGQSRGSAAYAPGTPPEASVLAAVTREWLEQRSNPALP